MSTWQAVYDVLGITKEDLNFQRMLIRQKEVMMCTLAEASDLVEGERGHNQKHCHAMMKAVEWGESGHVPDVYDIQELHSMLFPAGGKWRTTDVWFKGCDDCPPAYQHVPHYMREYVEDCKWWLTRSSEDDYIKLAHLHIQYEWIHGFTDGNGRVGRMILNSHAAFLNLPYIKITCEVKKDYIYFLENKDEQGLANLFMACSI